MIQNIGVFQDFQDGTLKSVFETEQHKIIEMSLLFNKPYQDVVCVPTHHYCNLGCKMCHLTRKGIHKGMVPIQVQDFIHCLLETLTQDGKKITDKKNLLISFMGVGEPLLNLSLIRDVFLHENEIKESLGYEHIGYALATMMPNENIHLLRKMVQEYQIPLKVHFSMHTPIDLDRYELIPSTKVSVEDALSSLILYREALQKDSKIMDDYSFLHRTNDPVEIHYTLIQGVNDGGEELSRICELLKSYQIPIKFIRFNPINELKMSERENIWIQTIQEEVPNLRIKSYSPPGREVGSSCGEFTRHYYHEEIETEEEKEEFLKWKVKHLIR